MRAVRLIFNLGVIALLLFPAAGFGEIIEGQVTALSPYQNSVGILRTNPVSDKEEILNISVNGATRYRGLSSINELEFGDDVRIDGQLDRITKSWEARSIKKT
ncbi:MAG: hypothetical protein HYZ83_08355 [Candidatus Omnitrophica bacterium]|nr:hypothetical protein [Candidatus Omnitrophota bacterium]